CAVLRTPPHDIDPWRAHSIETVTSVHKTSALKARTNDTDGMAAGPRETLAKGTPRRALLEKMPPNAQSDWGSPSIRNAIRATMRPNTKTSRHPPKKARSSRVSTRGSL